MQEILSQFSFLNWENKKLYFDDSFNLGGLLNALNLPLHRPLPDRVEEFAEITRFGAVNIPNVLEQKFEAFADLVFTEGKRTRISHLKIERSPLLRRMFFTKFPSVICDMCDVSPLLRYPWSGNLLEIHHLLPLSSGIAVTNHGTSLNDVVPLCPNCHRATHVYYKLWLDGNVLNDFSSKTEALSVYQEAKKNVVL